jgi:predicted transcriptional regulator
MATELTIRVSEELLAQLQAHAEAQGKSVVEVAEETLRKGVGQLGWQEVLAYGLERGKASGYTEPDVPDVVRANRLRHR